MDSPETFSLEGLDVAVTESPDAVTYEFTPHAQWRPGFPVISLLLFVGLPLAILALIAYAFDVTRGTRPDWELAFTGLFVVQLLTWSMVGIMAFIRRAFSMWWTYRHGTALVLTGSQLRHAGEVVCEQADVRALRLLVFPSDDAPGDNSAPQTPAKTKGTLSFVIGDEGYTHGLLASFDAVELRRLADDIHRRLSALRHCEGVMAPFPPLEVVETTAEEAAEIHHTRPLPGNARTAIALLNFGMLVFTNPIVSTLWCGPMLAGLYASARLIRAAGLGWSFLAGHLVLGFLHVIFLLGAWGSFNPAEPTNHETKAK